MINLFVGGVRMSTDLASPYYSATLAETIKKFDIELDAFQAIQKKQLRSYYLNVLQIPTMRLVCYLATSLVILAHNRYVLGVSALAPVYSFLMVSMVYSGVSWAVLFLYYRKVKWIHLGDLFLMLDFSILAYCVYCSGGTKSLLFCIFFTRIYDQITTNRTRVFLFGAAAMLSYTILIFYLDRYEHHSVSWVSESAKLLMFPLFAMHSAFISSLTQYLRNRVSNAIHIAREFTNELKVKAEQLEEARAHLETMLQREMEVNRSLKELNQMKTNFLIITSHEMRTPLTIIKGYNEALLAHLLGSLSEVQKRSLEACQHAVNRLTMTLEDIVEMLKISEGHLQLRLSRFDLVEVVHQAVVDLAPFVERRHQQVKLDLPDRCLLEADAKKMHLVLVNLLQNAIKFTPDAGQITIRVRQEQEQVFIEVEDSGIGIEATELERIFEKFYSNQDPDLHSSGAYQFMARGAGLGLSIVKSYVESHKGRIWAESKGKGCGSLFKIVLNCSV